MWISRKNYEFLFNTAINNADKETSYILKIEDLNNELKRVCAERDARIVTNAFIKKQTADELSELIKKELAAFVPNVAEVNEVIDNAVNSYLNFEV